MIYFPISLILTFVFEIMNIFLVPLAYIKHLGVLIDSVANSDETMDELSEKLQRVFTIIKFAIIGLPLLIFACLLDAVNFWHNLYTKPYDADDVIDK